MNLFKIGSTNLSSEIGSNQMAVLMCHYAKFLVESLAITRSGEIWIPFPSVYGHPQSAMNPLQTNA